MSLPTRNDMAQCPVANLIQIGLRNRSEKGLRAATRLLEVSIQPLRARVVVADDHDQWRHYVVLALRAKPEYQIVGEAENGMTAIQKAEEHQPDLVILDIGLPDLTGIEVARRISLLSPKTRIIFLSMHYSQDIIAAALSTGAYGYVLKSMATSDLLPGIEAVLAGNHFISQRAC